MQVVRQQDWEALDREVRGIMTRVWGVEPIDLGDRLLLTAGPADAVARLRESVAWVRLQTTSQLLELQAAGTDREANLDWLDAFIREHEPHRHSWDR